MKYSVKPEVLTVSNKVSYLLAREGVQAYLVGGLVRDILLGRDTADIDIAVKANAMDVAPMVASALGGKYIPLDEANGIARVVLMDGGGTQANVIRELDFSTIEGDIEQDMAKRDFTVDAMAIVPGKIASGTFCLSDIIDPFNGLEDIRSGVIRATTETVFELDAARLLRAVRLCAELGFSIDTETEALIKQHCQLITSVAAERIREELLRILAIPGSGQFLTYLDELGLLTAIIPELTQAKNVEQPWAHYWDVFDHSLQTISTVDFLLRQGKWEHAGEQLLTAVPWSPELERHFAREVSSGSTRSSLLKLAALLHDIAKPQTKAIDENGRARFTGHPLEGVSITVAIMERLRFSTREIKLVELLVQHHLRPGQMSHEGLPSRRAIYRYFRDTGEAGIDILFLSLADHLAARGPTLDLAQWKGHTQLVEYVLSQYLAKGSPATPSKIVDGHDLIKTFDMSPGPEVGKLLEALHEAQAAGEVTDKEAALSYINHLLAASSGDANK